MAHDSRPYLLMYLPSKRVAGTPMGDQLTAAHTISDPQIETALLRTIKVLLALVVLTPLVVTSRLLPVDIAQDVNWLLPDTVFPFVVGKALFTYFLTEVAFGLWVLVCLRNPSYAVPRSWLLAAFAIYTAITLAAALAGVSSQRSIWSTYERMQGFMAVAHWFVYAWILVSVYRTRADWRAVLNLGLGVGVVLAMVGLAQSEGIELAPYIQAQRRVYSLLGNPTYVGSYMLICIMVAGAFLAHSYCNPPVESVPRPQPRERQQLGGRRRRRARERQALPTLSPPVWAGAWLSAIGLAGLLAVIFGTTLLFWLMVLVLLGFGASYYLQGSRRGCWWRVFWMVSIALSLYLIALSGTRGAAVGLIGALALSAFVYALIGKVRVGRLACAGALAFLLIAPLVVYAARNTPPVEAVRDRSTIVDRLLRIGPDDRSVQGRTSSALTGLRAYADRPILGWGPENYTIAYDRHVSAETASSVSESFDQAHNKLIEELTTKGLLGFASYSMIWVLMAAILYLRAKGQMAREQPLTVLLGGAAAAYFIQNLFLFDTPGTVVWFLLLFGYAGFLETTRDPAITGEEPQGPATPAPKLLARVPNAFRSGNAYGIAGVVALSVVGLAVFFLVARPFAGGKATYDAHAFATPGLAKVEAFERAVNAFPPLGNYPRISMFSRAASELQSLSPEEALAVIASVEQALADGLSKEPEEWRMHIGAASVYHAGRLLDPDYLPRAGELLREANELAPGRYESVRGVAIQHMMESDFDGARAVIDAYVAQYADAERHFRDILEQMEPDDGS